MKRSFLSLFNAPLAMVLLVTSCVRDVVLDAGEDPQVVVECVLSDDDVQEMHLNFTKGASKDETSSLTETAATLVDLTAGTTIGQFVKKEGDLWVLDYRAVPGHHYRLEVQVPGYDLIWAEDTMPRSVNIHSYTTHFKQFDERDNNSPETYAYYFNGTYFMFEADLSRPVWVYGLDIDPDCHWKADNTSLHGPIAGEIYTDIPTADNFNVKNKIYIPQLEVRPDYAVDHKKIIGVLAMNYPDLAGTVIHDRFLRIDGGRAYEPFLITCNFKQWWDPVYPLRSFGDRPMIFMSVSEVYDDYLKTALIMDEVKKSSDMSAIYLRDNLPSNIHGGIGVFGCKYEQTLSCFVMDTFIPIADYPKYNIGEDHRFTFETE